MSNIYIQEPPTSGKVLLVTSVGDIDIELWSKEAPKACRNFVQLCLEGYYDGTIFHRMVPDFIVQGGDPTGTGHGGESVYGKPFQDEFHSRLRFVRRGLVAMANAGAHDNQSQFFFTLGATPELNNKHTVFGKVGGNTIYNMIKLGEGETDRNERPLFPHKIIKTKVIQNPFEDIVPRVVKSSRGGDSSAKSKKSDAPAKKDFKLLSFGEEAEEEERETTEIAQTLRSKGKSSHDLLNDTRLSAVPAVDSGDSDDETSSKLRNDSNLNESNYEGKNVDVTGEAIGNVRKKLKGGSGGQDKHTSKRRSDADEEYTDDARDGSSQPFELKSSSKLAELKAEAKRLKMELASSQKKKKNEQRESESNKNIEQTAEKPTTHAQTAGNDEIDEFRAARQKYKEQSAVKLKKGSDREAETLKMLAAFQSKIASAKKLSEFVSGANDESDDKGSDKEKEEDSGDDDADDFSWVRHQLHFESSERKVLDANVTDVDRYEVYDPRNPLTQRRREASAKAMKQKR